MQVSVRLFGAFRKYSTNGALLVEVEEGATVADLRRAMGAAIARAHGEEDRVGELLARSAFAGESRVLAESEAVTGAGPVAVLPPVCGG